MKAKIIILLVLLFNVGCFSSKKFYNSGSVNHSQSINEIQIEMLKDLAFCKVQINNKSYKFLIDTGAPMVVSEEIFKELGIREVHLGNISDSQNRKQRQKLAIIPQIKINDIEFTDIACVVIDIQNEVLKCFEFDGIVGANMMAKLFWKFDYQNNKIFTSTDLSNFEVENFDYTLNFEPKNQKTPIIDGKLKDKNVSFTFDTGFNGNIKVSSTKDIQNSLSSEDVRITKAGAGAIGIYGRDNAEKTYEMKLDLHLEDFLFENEIVSSGNSSLIGNKFLQDYIFVFDWVENKIYLQKNSTISPKAMKGFGFTYHFIDMKPTVVTVIEDFDIPVQLGDEILIMDETDFTKIENIDICEFILDSSYELKNEVDLTILRNSDTLNYTLQRQVFIK